MALPSATPKFVYSKFIYSQKELLGSVYTLDRGRDLGMILSMGKEISGIEKNMNKPRYNPYPLERIDEMKIHKQPVRRHAIGGMKWNWIITVL